jgi:Domain of unknown function (DUF4382)
MNILPKAALAAVALSAWIAGCGGGGGIEGTGATTQGTMRLSITDAPACGYDAVHLTIEKVRVHKAATAVDADAGWSEVVLAPPKRVDLLTLTNGVLEELGQTVLPAGKYTQMRLILAANGGATPLANSVTPTGGAETALTTPSAQQSGLKLNVDLDVAPNQVADFAIDFDACKSVVKRGNSGQYNLKPVVSVIPIVADAGLRVVGYVEPSLANTANVSVQFNGVPVKATVPDPTGRFVLYPVPAGAYDLVVTAAGRVSAVMTGVPVTTTAFTNVNSVALPISLPVAVNPRAVTGTVTPATATVRALQTLSGGPKVEVAWGAVDADTSAFAFSLPIEAPLKVAYAANPVALPFAADAAAAGKYTLEAESNGATKTLAIDAAAVVPSVVFTFP